MANMAVTTTEITYSSCKKITFAWLSDDAAGTAGATTTAAFDGKLIGVATIPGTGGDQPDDNYDVVLNDADGHDVLLGQGANRDETNTEYLAMTVLGGVAGSKLTLGISGAGNALQGTVIIWIR